jgi:hypothetical protein
LITGQLSIKKTYTPKNIQREQTSMRIHTTAHKGDKRNAKTETATGDKGRNKQETATNGENKGTGDSPWTAHRQEKKTQAETEIAARR